MPLVHEDNTRYKLFFDVFASAVTARYWRLTITDATLSTIDIGRLFLGPFIRPTVGSGPQYRIIPVDQSIVRRTESGRNLTYQKPILRRVQVQWDRRLDSDGTFDLFNNIDFDSSLLKDIVFSLSEDHSYPHENTVLCRIERHQPTVLGTADVNTKTYQFIENG